MIHRVILLAILAGFLCGFGAIEASELLDAQTLLQRSPMQAPRQQDVESTSPAIALLADIEAFRRGSERLTPEQAAKDWLGLFERARALGDVQQHDIRAYDAAIGAPVGLASVLAALPPPGAWPALRDVTRSLPGQAKDHHSALVLRLLGELLANDRGAASATVGAIDALSGELPRGQREATAQATTALRNALALLDGDTSEIASAFERAVAEAAKQSYSQDVETPDLVALLGEERATALLAAALQQPVVLQIEIGKETRALARRLALQQIDSLQRPQWALIDSITQGDFHAQMRKRFDPAGGAGDPGMPAMLDFDRRTADAYFFVALVIERRHEEATQVLQRLAGDSPLHLPAAVVSSLLELNANAALVDYLDTLLRTRPDLDAWQVFLEQSAYVGRHEAALKQLDGLLARNDLDKDLRERLEDFRIDALLAADQIEPGLAALADAVARSGKGESSTEALAASVRLAALARVLDRPELAGPALRIAEQHYRRLLADADEDYGFADAQAALFAELRHQGQAATVQALALAVLARPIDPARADFVAMQPGTLPPRVLIELAGIYHHAGRHRDVLLLADEAIGWGARDSRPLLDQKDSLGVPFGVMLARALADAGDTAQARTTVELLLDRLPGHDGGYAVLVELLGEDAVPELDRRYGFDPFEERPLIWKAIALKAAGKRVDSEQAIRAAIAIDPSDGEQGRDDRMRAYGVLADLLEAKGDTEAAATYRGAVSAIRLSEQADALHALGLYQRAFTLYRRGLDAFADAYCIQSRLAVQLSKQGQHAQAMAHYRRAFELMPDSFGRVESHCFGCESVFRDPAAQTIAEEVFTRIIAESPSRPQAHYMLAYLRSEQGRYAEALPALRFAVSLDSDYLNAWKKLHELGGKTHIAEAERDIARLKLIELDPRQRHVRHDTKRVGDLAALWSALEVAAARQRAQAIIAPAYVFAGNAQALDRNLAALPENARAQWQHFQRMNETLAGNAGAQSPATVVGKHALLMALLQLLGESPVEYADTD